MKHNGRCNHDEVTSCSSATRPCLLRGFFSLFCRTTSSYEAVVLSARSLRLVRNFRRPHHEARNMLCRFVWLRCFTRLPAS